MARYIDADEAKSVIKANDWSNPCVPTVVNMILDRMPTADVVPRSEYESLRKRMLPSYVQAVTEEEAMKIGYERGKVEVAREIFEEIERRLPNEFPFLGTAVAVYLEELKKKYTEKGETGDAS